MSDDRDLVETAADELRDQVDVAGLVTGDDVTEQIDGESLGRSLGEAVGAIVGRRFGRRIGRVVRSKFLGGDADADRSLFERAVGAVLVALGRTLEKPQFRDPIEDALREFVENREERLAEAEEEAEDVAEEAEESAEDAAGEAKESVEGVADLSSSELQELKSETYRDLLEMMEYSQIQSIAKEVGVKANLGRDEMVDEIVEQFDDSSNESGDRDESDANDAAADESDG